MGVLNVSETALKKYFSFLNTLDNSSKNKLIERLRASISEPKKQNNVMSKIYGAWEDEDTAEQQILTIRNARINQSPELDFE